MAKARRRTPGSRTSSYPRDMTLKRDDVLPGDCVSCDHYISPVPGRVVAPSGYSSVRHGYQGGTIYVDHASGWIFHRPQKTLSVSDTIRGKLILEREASDVGATIRRYHTDNGVFNCSAFKSHCASLTRS